MGKYKNDQEYLIPKPNRAHEFEKSAAIFNNQVKERDARTIIDNPQSSPIQKAMALEGLHPNLGKQLLHDSTQQQIADQKMQTQQQEQLRNEQINNKLFGNNGATPPIQDPKRIANVGSNSVNERAGVPAFNKDFMQSPVMNAQQQFQQGNQNPITPPNSIVPEQNQVQPNEGSQSNLMRLPQEDLDAAMLMTTNPNTKAVLQNENKRRNTLLENEGKIAAAKIKSDSDTLKYNTKQVLPIQQESEKSIKSTNISLKALQDQYDASDKTGTYSRANLANILIDSDSKLLKSLGKAIQDESGALFSTASKEIITAGLKNAFGAKPLGMEFEAFQQMLAQPGKNPAVNKLTIKSLMVPLEIENAIAKFKMDEIANNPNINAIELNSKAYKFGEEYSDKVLDAWRGEVRSAMNPGERTQAVNTILEDIFK